MTGAREFQEADRADRQSTRALVFLLAAALGIRLVLILLFPTIVVEFPDKVQRYDPIAQSLLRGEGFSRGGQPTAVSPPVYPLFLAALYGAFGFSLQVARIGLAAVDVLGCGIWFLVARRWFGRDPAILTVLVLAFSPYLVYPILVGAGDTLFVTAHAALLWLVGRAIDRPTWLRFAAAGFALGVAALCRPSALLLPLVLIPAMLLALRGQRIRRTALSGALLVSFFLTLTPWTVRNFVHFHRLIPIQSIGGAQLSKAAKFYNPDSTVSLQPREALASGEAGADQGRYLQVLEDALANPFATAKRLLISIATMWFASHSGHLLAFLIPANAVLLTLAAVGAWLTRQRTRLQMPLYAVVAYYVAVHSPLLAIFRYLLPTVPILVMLASIPALPALGWFARRLPTGSWTRRGAGTDQ